MADRTVTVRLVANVSGLAAGLRQGSSAVGAFNQNVESQSGRSSASIRDLSNAFGVVGIAAVGAAGLAVRAFANFDEGMSAVQAATHASADEMGLLRQAALDAGESTVFSATEAAGAIENLAKAGVSTSDILGGGLSGSLDLAAAGNLEVADAAEIAATAMTQFGLSGSDVTHIADLLAAGAGKAQGDVTDMAFALRQAGLVSNQFGISIEETVGTLTAFAAAGLLGSDAGTSFRTMLLRMANPSREAADTMERLGIAAYDAEGSFVGVADLAGQLQAKLGPLTQAQRDQALATIFGSDAIRAANILMEQGTGGIQKWTNAVDDQGFAAETAALRLDNLKGDLEALGGALETAFINSAEGSNNFLRTVVQNVTEAVNSFNDLPSGIQTAALALVGGGGLVALGVAGMGRLTVAINDARIAAQALGVSLRAVSIAGGVLGLAIAGAGIILSAFLSEKAKGRQIVEDFTAALEADSGAFGENAAQVLAAQISQEGLADKAKDAGVALDTVTEAAAGNQDAMALLVDKQEEYQAQLDELYSGGAGPGALSKDELEHAASLRTKLSAIEEVIGGTTELSGHVEEAKGKYEEEQVALEAANGALGITTTSTEEAAAAQAQLGADFDATTEGIQTQAEALANLVAQMQAAGLLAIDIRQTQLDLASQMADTTAAIDETGVAIGFNTEKGRENEQALNDLASQALETAGALLENAGTADQASVAMENARASFVAAAVAAGYSEEEANTLANTLGLIPGDYVATVSAPGAVAADAQVEAANTELSAFDRRNVNANANIDVTGIGAAERELNNTARNRSSTITVSVRTSGRIWDGTQYVNPGLRASGGWITGYAAGGMVAHDFRYGGGVRYGTHSRADDVLALVSRDEYVVRASQAKRHKSLLEAINRGQIAGSYANGGTIGPESIGLSSQSESMLRTMIDEARGLNRRPVQLVTKDGRVAFELIDGVIQTGKALGGGRR